MGKTKISRSSSANETGISASEFFKASAIENNFSPKTVERRRAMAEEFPVEEKKNNTGREI